MSFTSLSPHISSSFLFYLSLYSSFFFPFLTSCLRSTLSPFILHLHSSHPSPYIYPPQLLFLFTLSSFSTSLPPLRAPPSSTSFHFPFLSSSLFSLSCSLFSLHVLLLFLFLSSLLHSHLLLFSPSSHFLTSPTLLHLSSSSTASC